MMVYAWCAGVAGVSGIDWVSENVRLAGVNGVLGLFGGA